MVCFRNTFIFLLLCLCACQPSQPYRVSNPLEVIKDPVARDILNQALKHAGGLDKWNSLNRIEFTKDWQLFDALGQIELDRFENHTYQFKPELSNTIRWNEEDNQVVSLEEQGQFIRICNEQVDQKASPDQVAKQIQAATFVFGLPYNLLDSTAHLTYSGRDTLEDGVIVEVLSAAYHPEDFDHHTTADTWTIFFDYSSHSMVGYMVHHADHYAYVRDLSKIRLDGFEFPEQRRSWRVTPDREIKYLRATYLYGNYVIQ